MRELAKPRQARASEARARGAAALADLYGSTDAARAGVR